MIKYDETISTLTLVNILAKDIDYGNVRQENLLCNMEQRISKIYCEISKFYDLRVRNLFDRAIIKICNFSFAKLKGVCKNIFFTAKTNLIIFLQKLVLYCEKLKVEHGGKCIYNFCRQKLANISNRDIGRSIF